MRRRIWIVAVLALAAAPGVAAAQPSESMRAGEAAIVSEAGPSGRGILGGGSKTTFSIRLPTDAACPGDSRDEGYRVQSFLVPEGDDPAALRFGSGGPEGGAERYPLYDVFTSSFVNAQTANAAALGAQGPIFDLPDFDFATFPRGEITPGRYRVGIACTLSNATMRYWDTVLRIDAAPKDQPSGLQWQVMTPGRDQGAPSGSVSTAPVVLAAGALGGGLLLTQRRRRRHRSNVPLEDR